MNANEDRWTTFAEVLSHCGGMATRLVDLHVDDGTGRCAVCSQGGQAGRYAWPCAIRLVATRALRLQARRLARDATRFSGLSPSAGEVGASATTSDVIDRARHRDHDR